MLPDTISRRSFLKGLGLAGAGLAVSGVAAPACAQVQARSNTARPEPWRAQLHDETRLLMGTIVRITTSRASKTQAEQGMGMAFAEMERLIAMFDRHQSGTAVSVLNAQQSLSDAPREFIQVVEKAVDYNVLTSRSFDITVQPVLELLARHSNPTGGISLSKAEMAEALALVDASGVRVSGGRVTLARSGMGVTLDGIAKGYIVDQAAAVLEAQGVSHYLINAGGDIRCGGEKRPGVAWRVAVEDPAKNNNYQSVLAVSNGAVATSGGYERYFDKNREHTHLLQPETGRSPQDCASVTVQAPTAMQADALATALSMMPYKAAPLVDQLPGCACLIIMRDGSKIASGAWKSV